MDKLDALEKRLFEALSPRTEIAEAYLFGSQATGRSQAHSDIDVAVWVDPPNFGEELPYGYQANPSSYLMQALSTNEIDVIVLNRAPPVLYHRVLRDGRRILARDLAATTTREGYALSKYCDYVPQIEKYEAARRAAGRRP